MGGREGCGRDRHFLHLRPGRQLTAAARPRLQPGDGMGPAGPPAAETVDGRTTRLHLRRRRAACPPPDARRVTSRDVRRGGQPHPHGTRRPTTGLHHTTSGARTERSFGLPRRPVALTDHLGRRGGFEQSLADPGRTLRSRAYTYRADNHLPAVTNRLTGRTRRSSWTRRAAATCTRRNWTEAVRLRQRGNQTRRTGQKAPQRGSRGPRTYAECGCAQRRGAALHHDAAGRVDARQKPACPASPRSGDTSGTPRTASSPAPHPTGPSGPTGYDPFGRRRPSTAAQTADGQWPRPSFRWDGTRLANREQSTPATASA